MAAIATVFAMEPEMILMDEPTTAVPQSTAGGHRMEPPLCQQSPNRIIQDSGGCRFTPASA